MLDVVVRTGVVVTLLALGPVGVALFSYRISVSPDAIRIHRWLFGRSTNYRFDQLVSVERFQRTLARAPGLRLRFDDGGSQRASTFDRNYRLLLQTLDQSGPKPLV